MRSGCHVACSHVVGEYVSVCVNEACLMSVLDRPIIAAAATAVALYVGICGACSVGLLMNARSYGSEAKASVPGTSNKL